MREECGSACPLRREHETAAARCHAVRIAVPPGQARRAVALTFASLLLFSFLVHAADAWVATVTPALTWTRAVVPATVHPRRRAAARWTACAFDQRTEGIAKCSSALGRDALVGSMVHEQREACRADARTDEQRTLGKRRAALGALGRIVKPLLHRMLALFVAIGLQAWAPQPTRAATAPLQQQSTLHLGGSDRPCLGLRGGQGNSVGASVSSGSEARQQALDAVKAAEAELKALTAAEKEERERAAVLEEEEEALRRRPWTLKKSESGNYEHVLSFPRLFQPPEPEFAAMSASACAAADEDGLAPAEADAVGGDGQDFLARDQNQGEGVASASDHHQEQGVARDHSREEGVASACDPRPRQNRKAVEELGRGPEVEQMPGGPGAAEQSHDHEQIAGQSVHSGVKAGGQHEDLIVNKVLTLDSSESGGGASGLFGGRADALLRSFSAWSAVDEKVGAKPVGDGESPHAETKASSRIAGFEGALGQPGKADERLSTNRKEEEAVRWVSGFCCGDGVGAGEREIRPPVRLEPAFPGVGFGRIRVDGLDVTTSRAALEILGRKRLALGFVMAGGGLWVWRVVGRRATDGRMRYASGTRGARPRLLRALYQVKPSCI